MVKYVLITKPWASTDEERLAVLDRAWELGCTNWDTADIYGDNEDLLGKWFALHPERRDDIFLATKFGLTAGIKDDGTVEFGLDSTPEHARAACERNLARMGVESIDLYYVHRADKKTPIEKTMEVLRELKEYVNVAISLYPFSPRSRLTSQDNTLQEEKRLLS
jgi:aryl-alcohol dehydrogenase-like predicted oxidoreductase